MACVVAFFNLAQGIEEKLKSIDLDLMDSVQHPAKFSLGESISGQPHHIWFGEVNQKPARVFAEGHSHSGQFQQFIRVERVGTCDWFIVFW